MQTKIISVNGVKVKIVASGLATQKIPVQYLEMILGKKLKRFPKHTEFRIYEGKIPVALVPNRITGGAVCLAFDKKVPRGFPVGSYEKSDFIKGREFKKIVKSFRVHK